MRTIFALGMCFLSSCGMAMSGKMFQVVSLEGTAADIKISLCLNGKGPLSCQEYDVSTLNLQIFSTLNHNYPIAGIKLLTPGYVARGCTPYPPTGYCLFNTSQTAAAKIQLKSTKANMTYTIGGQVTGLLPGNSVVLQNNGGENLTKNADGSFTFAKAQASETHYAVTVFKQPGNQFCGVTNGAGTVGSSNVTSVLISCGGKSTSYTTPGTYSFTVPAGATSVGIVATGAGGGGGGTGGSKDFPGAAGGSGAIVTGVSKVVPGKVIQITVGGGGIGGCPASSPYEGCGGGGGGSTNFNAGSSQQIIAGGGGGGGAGSVGGAGGASHAAAGGNGASEMTSEGDVTGGMGGAGGNGGTGGLGVDINNPPTVVSGALGGTGDGGAGGAGSYSNMTSGGAGGSGSGAGVGGDANVPIYSYSTPYCGGGGGGYGGGGSGALGTGGGAGGSIGPAGTTYSSANNGGPAGANGGDGSIVITLH